MVSTIGMAIDFILDTIPAFVYFVVAIAAIVGTWRIFLKMGEKGWKCIIPLYNEYVVFRVVWSTKAFWIMIAISIAAGICSGITQILFEIDHNIASLVMSAVSLILLFATLSYQIKFCGKVAKAFGKGVGMTIALVFVPFIATLVLGFGSAQFKSSSK